MINEPIYARVGRTRINLNEILYYSPARLANTIVFRSKGNVMFEEEFDNEHERAVALDELDKISGTN